ncbi:MAG: SDR family oxidoreductase [Spirochaetes bacterium]|nr:SDR family oxidoreductase [Spirochaetota bacterium]MBU1079743.1 SDR family oxidoreductase [Spirochaetota bacterium]
MNDKRKRVVIVTGASSGLGNACATHLAKKGFVVYGTSRRPDEKNRRADEFFELVRMDATDDDSVTSVVDYVLAKDGRIDALLCCAGIGIAGAVEEVPIVEAARQMDVNFLGVARAVRAVLPSMRVNGGTVLVLGSMAGLVGVPFQAYYAASKFALEGFVDSLRMEVGGAVRVALIEPGDFRTGFTAAREVFGLAEGGPYSEAGRRAIGGMERSEREGSDPVIVARLALKLLDARRLRARYSVGPWGQRLAMALRRALPRRIFELILMAYYGVPARNGASK